jgi:hypothetical protein
MASLPRRIGGGGRWPAQLSVNENGQELVNVRRRIDRRVGKHRVDVAASRRSNLWPRLEHNSKPAWWGGSARRRRVFSHSLTALARFGAGSG